MIDASMGRADRLRAASRELGLSLDETAVAHLIGFLDMLQRWNATYNLTAVRDPDEMLSQHVVDCLAAVAAMQRRLGSTARRVLDVGSGGGLPGVVIAVARPGDRVVCVDAVGKKAAFVRQVAAELRIRNLSAEHQRVEMLDMAPSDVIVSRAFSSLADFVRLSRQHLSPQGIWMAMKGKHPDEEIAELPPDVDVFHVEHLDVPGLTADRCLVWMRPRAET